jgi:hypothetical protein
MIYLVFSVAIDLSGLRMRYRSDFAYITRRKRVLWARIVDLSCFHTNLKRSKTFCCFVCFIKRAILRFA